jgi:hypothetical protein
MGCVSRVVLRPLWVPTLISQTKCCAEKFQLNVVPLAERQVRVATASSPPPMYNVPVTSPGPLSS